MEGENMLKTILILSLIFSLSAFSGDKQKVLNIVNTKNINEFASIYINSGNNQITSIEIITNKEEKKYSIKSIQQGQTLLKKRGIKVIYIESKNLNPSTGGDVNIRYLKKFKLFGSDYRNFKLTLEKVNGLWEFKSNGIVVKELSITPYSLGISEIRLD